MNIQDLFSRTTRPSRYINSEWNSKPVPADLDNRVRICFCFPDVYDLGGSNLGIEILYQLVNLRGDTYAERSFLPEEDFSQLLRQENVPLSSLESKTDLKKFDLVGFTLPFELCWTNVLQMLDLAGIPLSASDRDEKYPLIIGGGPCATANPEPMTKFFDLFVLGDGEEVINEIIDLVKESKKENYSREKLLLKLANVPGVYVPRFYTIEYDNQNKVSRITNDSNVPATITKRVVDLKTSFYPNRPMVPYLNTVHNRLNIEIARGCKWRCRFCQARNLYYPLRERPLERVIELIEQGIYSTGYDEVSLSSLSSGDYSRIVDLVSRINSVRQSIMPIKLSLPSLRCETFTEDLSNQLSNFPPSTFTFAPESGSERLRQVLGKHLSEQKIFETVGLLMNRGFRKIKFYFMFGLPTETQADLEDIIKLVRNLRRQFPRIDLHITLSPFVPKPQTAFQWVVSEPVSILEEKRRFLVSNLRGDVRAHSIETAFLESIFARGDRRLGEVIQRAWEKGCRFDQWSERLKYSAWLDSFQETGIATEQYLRARNKEEILPWNHLGCGMEKESLWDDYQNGLSVNVVESSDLTVRDEEISQAKACGYQDKSSQTTAKEGFKQGCVQKLRFRFARENSLRFLSQLEQVEMLRRIFRRAGLPVIYTQGFNPQIKASFGPAVSVGYLSQAEYVDLELGKFMDIKTVYKQVNEQLPPGLSLKEVKTIAAILPSLERYINLVEYRITSLPESLFLLAEDKIKWLLTQKELFWEREKQGKKENIEVRALVKELEFVDDKLRILLRFGPKKNIKPDFFVQNLFGLLPDDVRLLEITRENFYREGPDGSITPP